MHWLNFKKTIFPPVAAIVLSAVAILACGCAIFSEPIRKLSGLSVDEFRRGKKPKTAQVIPLPYEECFQKSLAALQAKGIVIHMQSRDKGYIIVRKLPRSIDTTKAAIFFRAVKEGTEVEVVSASSNAMEDAAGIIFPKEE